MKKIKKNKSLYSIVLPAVFIVPFVSSSCSKNYTNAFVSSNSDNYSSLWNVSLTDIADRDIYKNPFLKNSLYSMKISELNQLINEQIENDQKMKKIMEIFSFLLLWQAIKNPYTRDGKRVSILSKELKDYDNFLTNELIPDNPSDVDDKTYKNFDKFIESFYDLKINIISFRKNNTMITIDSEQKVGDLINSLENLELLNFQFSFKIKNKEANTLIINKNDKNKHIFYKTTTNREERKIIKDNENTKIDSLIKNQFNYQGSKMYYDIENQTFKSIILTSNIKFNGVQNTKPSGFIETYDTQRNMFYLDFKQVGDKNYEQYLILDLSKSNYFDTNLSADFNNYLKKEKIIDENNKIKNVEFKLNKFVNYEISKEETQ